MRSADDLRLLSDLLEQALDLTDAERGMWLQGLRGEAERLAPTLRELLARAAAKETADLLQRGPSFTATGSDAVGPGFAAGDTVGPYRLLRELGRGGMGEVWLAERSDGQLKRQVALKLPMLGLSRSMLVERFARERDILGALVHPHIARLYDAGITESGQPYMALEVVAGTSLGAYCDAHRLGTAQRLRLAMQILDAVQYAHTRLVIHRDLKPSNILVTEDGQVRLLDFGVAKLLADEDGVERTQLTQLAGPAFTPDYASPEQVRGGALGTASDVYSLGVVLYELLCGQRPYKLKLSSAAQIEQAILEAEPQPPSARVGEEAANARGTTVRKLRRELQGELDTIVLKALKKKPEDRYGTVAELADDLRRHRDGEPVLARPDSFAYRASKFVIRHRVGVGASAVAALSMSVATGVSLWQARIAHLQADRALAVRTFLTDIFRANSDTQPDPEQARRTTARQLLDIGASHIDGNFQRDPEGRADVLDMVGEMYFDLGLDEEAADFYRRRVEALKQAFGPRDPRVAEALTAYGKQLHGLDREGDEAKALNEAKRILDLNGDDQSEQRASLLSALARANVHRPAQALPWAEQAAAIYRRYHAQGNRLPGILIELGVVRWHAGDNPGAEAALKEALALLAKTPDSSVSGAITALLALADVQMLQLKIDEAERSLRLAMEKTLSRNGPAHEDTLHVQARLGWLLHYTSRRGEGRQILDAAFKQLGAGHYSPNATWAVNSYYGQALVAEGRIQEAAPIVAWMIREDRKTAGGRNSMLVTSLRAQAELLTMRGRLEQARRSLDESWSLLSDLGLDTMPSITNGVVLARARLDIAEGHAERALASLRDIRPLSKASQLPIRVYEIRALALQSVAETRLGLTGQAEQHAQAAVEAVTGSALRDRFQVAEAEAQLALGRALMAANKPADAKVALGRAVELRRLTEDASSPNLSDAELALADCLRQVGETDAATALDQQARARLSSVDAPNEPGHRAGPAAPYRTANGAP